MTNRQFLFLIGIGLAICIFFALKLLGTELQYYF